MRTICRAAMVAATIAGLVGVVVGATETTTYTYDARGRLIRVAHSGTVNNNVVASYSYDKADNRTNVNVASPNSPPP